MRTAILVAMAALAVPALAQQPPASRPAVSRMSTNLVERTDAPSYSDMNCSGFITNEHISDKNLVVGGANTPEQSLFVTGNDIFIAGGGLQEGTKYTVLRQLRDPNEYEAYKGQRSAISSAGQPYAELGQVEVFALRGPTAVAKVTFNCQGITAGDIVVPVIQHPPVTYRAPVKFDQWPGDAGRLSARIVMAYDFDTVIHVGQKVYINAGSDKGVKPGDYFRAIRSYDPDKIDPVDALSYKSPSGEDTQKRPMRISGKEAKDFPYHAIGEMIVLSVTPTSSTAMITRAIEAVEIGDAVQLEGEGQPAAPAGGESGN